MKNVTIRSSSPCYGLNSRYFSQRRAETKTRASYDAAETIPHHDSAYARDAGRRRTSALPASAQAKKPNIVFIMGDDIGIWNIGAYHRGMMAGKTPNLDKLAAE